MGYLSIAILVLSLATPCVAWENPCYKGALSSTAFPRENRSSLTLEARRVVSVQGNLMIYDLGRQKVVIRMEGVAPLAFLKEVQKGRCAAKGFVTVEVEKKGFSETGTYRAVTPGPR